LRLRAAKSSSLELMPWQDSPAFSFSEIQRNF